MPKETAAIGERETRATFEVINVALANQLVGNYSPPPPPQQCIYSTQLGHDHLNCVFELVGVNYQPCPEPIACVVKKCQASTSVVALPPLKKTGGVKRWKRASSQAGEKTAKQDKLLAKPLKPSKKFTMQKAGGNSLGLSIKDKALSMNTPFRPPMITEATVKKIFVISVVGDDSDYASTCI
jgi:hypothetical protein